MNYLRKHPQSFLLIGIVAISFALMIFSSQEDSLTNDEKIHIPAGFLHVWQGDYTFNTEHPPLLNDLAGLFANIAQPNLPEKLQKAGYNDLFFYQSGNDVDKIVFWARFPFILLTLALIYLVFLWAKTLFGLKAGLVAAALTAFSPNILAHGRLATTDIGLVFFFVLTCWLLRKYVLKPNWGNAALLGFSLGLVLLTKFSAPLIIPIIFSGLIYLWLLKKPKFFIASGQVLIIILTSLIVVWAIYAFSMRSDMTNLLAPFDKYLHGLEVLSDNNLKGRDAYLNGMIDRGWWYYFPYVLLYKLTVPVMVLMLLTAIFFKRTKKDFFDEFLLIFPPLMFLAVAMLSNMNVGIRYILVILPFMFIFIGRLMTVQNLIVQRTVLILLGAQIVIGILAFPNYLAYFNQIAGGTQGGIKHLSDSNLDWHQNVKRFVKYARTNNIQKVYGTCWDGTSFAYRGLDYEALPKSPVNGVVVICAQQLVIPPPGINFSWVIKNPPDEIIANGIYVWRFDIKNPF